MGNGDGDTYCIWFTWRENQRLEKRAESLKNQSTNKYNPNYCIVEVGQNTEKSPEDLSRLAVSQPPVKDHQLTLV